MFVGFQLFSLSIILFHSNCKASLLGHVLCGNASYIDRSPGDSALEDESLEHPSSRWRSAVDPHNQGLHRRAASRFVNPWARRNEPSFDSQFPYDTRDTPEAFESSPAYTHAFVSAVQIARCKSKCLFSLAPELGKRRNDRGFLVPADCGPNEKCQTCEEACEVPYDKCEKQCGSRAGCRIACEFRRELMAQPEKVLVASTNLLGLRLDRPRAICLNYTATLVTGSLFKWSLFNTTSRLRLSSSVPVVFIVEHRTRSQQHRGEPWTLLGMLSQGLVPICGVPGSIHQYRVTPVTVDGILPARVSRWTLIPREPVRFEAPKEVRVIREDGSNHGIKATIALSHKGLPTCRYSVHLLPNSLETPAINIRSQPEDLFQNDLEGLQFATKYTLVIRSTDFTGTEESDPYKLELETPTCLQAFSHNFSICAPGPPSLVNVIGRKRGVRITWNPPPYTTTDNRVIAYAVTIEKDPLPDRVKYSKPLNITKLVDASVNCYDEEVIDEDRYAVSVKALSKAGIGVRAELYYRHRYPPFMFLNDPIALTGCAVIIFVVTAVGAYAVIWINRKSKEEARRIDDIETFTNMSLSVSGRPADYISAEVESRILKACKDSKLFVKQRNSETFAVVRKPLKRLLTNPLYARQRAEERFRVEKVGESLGSGAFGVVYEVIVQMDGKKETLALKMPNENLSVEERQAFREEVALHKLVGNHPNIVSLRGFCLDENNFSMFLEYCPLGNLKTYLDRTRNATSTRMPACVKMTSYLRQITSGMEYLASKRIIHRDLAARNILLASEETVKISDFGLSRDIYTEGLYLKFSRGKIPFRWMPLESFLQAEYSEKSDVWAFGVLMWEMATLGGQPFGALPPEVVVEQLRRGIRLHRPETCSIELYDIMKSCWQERPGDRPTFAELKQQLDVLLEQTQHYFSFESFNSSLNSGGSADSGVDFNPDDDSSPEIPNSSVLLDT